MLALHIANIGESLYNNNLMLSKQNISEYFYSEDNNAFNTILLNNFHSAIRKIIIIDH